MINVHIAYRTLFTVEIRHDFVLARGRRELDGHKESLKEQILRDYSIHEWMTIEPTEDTRSMMANHKLRLRRLPGGFALAGSVEESESSPDAYVLRQPLPEGFRLRFTLSLHRPAFLREANIPEPEDAERTFLFSNASGHLDEGRLHLSRIIGAFNAASSYAAGSYVVDQDPSPTTLLEAARDLDPAGATPDGDWIRLPHPPFDAAATYDEDDRVMHNGSVYEAVRDLTTPPHDPPTPPADPPDWRDVYTPSLRGGVTIRDRVRCVPGRFKLAVEGAPRRADITVRDENGDPVYEASQLRRDGNPLEEIEIVLPDPPAGILTLEALDQDGVPIAGLPESFYYHPEVRRGIPFAIIDLRAGSGDLALFTGDDELRSPDFFLRFRNRHAFWRYEFSGEVDDFPPADAGDLELEVPADPDLKTRYISKEPLPVTLGLLLAKFDDQTLPNPAPSSLRKENGTHFTEVFLKLK